MKPYFLFLGLCMCSFLFAQKNTINRKDSIRILNPKYFYSDLKSDKNSKIASLPFDSICFIDIRYDTTFIALNWQFRNSNHVYKSKYDITGGLAKGFADYFSNYYTHSSKSDGQLVCYVKKFAITWKQDLLDHFMQNIDFAQQINNNINVEIECFYRKGDSLYPATRIDTIFKGDFLISQTTFEDAVITMLSPLQNKIEHLNIKNISQRKAYSLQQIRDRYAARFQIPVLTATAYKKGLYTSFTDFRNNTPSIDSFLMSADKMKYSSSFSDYFGTFRMLSKATEKRNTAIFFYTPDKEPIAPSAIFAYCDGINFWIQHGSIYYLLVKVGNAFEFIYNHYYTDSSQLTQDQQILMPLDMETGKSN